MPTHEAMMIAQRRREQVLSRLMAGDGTQMIWEWYSSTGSTYGHLTNSSFKKDIEWAYKNLSQYTNTNFKNILHHHLNMYDRNANAAYKNGNYFASNQALQFKEKLLGMHRPDIAIQINTVTTPDLKQLTNDELMKIIDEANTAQLLPPASTVADDDPFGSSGDIIELEASGDSLDDQQTSTGKVSNINHSGNLNSENSNTISNSNNLNSESDD